MDRIIISDTKLNMTVGVYTIRIIYHAVNRDTYFLPYIAERFLDDKETDASKVVIDYTIQLEDTLVEPDDVPAAGFDDGPYPYRIYRMNSGGCLWIRKNKFGNIHLAYRISEDWSSWKLIADNSGSFGIDSFAELAFIFAFSILNKGGILFHGVVMEWQDMGVIVCAHSKVGKTTHTRMWRDNENALILNGDRALCCKEGEEWYTYGAPWSGSSGEALNQKTLLSAIVILEQAEVNETSVISPYQGALELIQLAFAPSWEEKLLNTSLDTIDEIVKSVPVIKLKCRPDLEAVEVLKKELMKIKATSEPAT